MPVNRENDNLQQQAKLIYDYWFTQFDFPDENGKVYIQFDFLLFYLLYHIFPNLSIILDCSIDFLYTFTDNIKTDIKT